MKFEGILTISMGTEFIHVFGNVDNFDCFEGAFLDADSTTNAKKLGDFNNGRSGHNIDAYFLCLVDGTRFLTLLLASFRFALFLVHNGNTVLVFHSMVQIIQIIIYLIFDVYSFSNIPLSKNYFLSIGHH